jgi:hypothetical protein
MAPERHSDHWLRLRVRRQPQRAGGTGRIEPEFLPPSGFVAVTMEFAMMRSAEWDRELVADLAPKSSVLREAQMMGIAWLTSADQTRLLGDKS